MSSRTKVQRQNGLQVALLGAMYAALKECETNHEKSCQCRYFGVVRGLRGFITVAGDTNPVEGFPDWEHRLPGVLGNLQHSLKWITPMRRINNVQRYQFTRLGRQQAARYAPPPSTKDKAA